MMKKYKIINSKGFVEDLDLFQQNIQTKQKEQELKTIIKEEIKQVSKKKKEE